ncbi:MAG: YARHG domain-containing protein [Bacteroidales bacterium]|nr:YARHG domain-containing protein [Bacteroidales bacterium]
MLRYIILVVLNKIMIELNEIFARHGYTFKGNLLAHFSRNSWYNPTTRNSVNLYNNYFSQIERDNVNFMINFGARSLDFKWIINKKILS